MSTKAFVSHADLQVRTASFTRLCEQAYAYTAEGDPNTGVVIGDNAVLVIDTQATPALAQDVIRRIREVTDKPIKYLVLSHYHAVRVLGAAAYGAEHIIASRETHELIMERGEQDKASEISRFPRLFEALESVPPGLTWPTLTFTGRMTLWLGSLEVQILQPGRGHTKGDTVVWLPQQKVLFSGDLVECEATPYAGDAYCQDWPQALDRLASLQPAALVPGRGAPLTTPEQVAAGLAGTRAFVSDLWRSVREGAVAGRDLCAVYRDTMARLRPKYGHWVIFDHCMPFDVTRCYEEATRYPEPRIWTEQRDIDMWKLLVE